LPIDLFEPGTTPGLRATLRPGAEREAAIAAMKDELAGRAAELENLSVELLELVAAHDPVQLIPSISMPASMGLADHTADDDAPRSFSWDAKIEYLTGLALAGPPGAHDVDHSVTNRALELVTAVFDAAHAQLFIRSTSETRTDRSGIDAASFLLRLEHLLDRMEGYAVHLEEIADEVFEPHRAFYAAELGFCPSDAVRLVRRHTEWVNREFNAGRDGVIKSLDSGRPEVEAATDFMCFHAAMDAAYLWSPDLLAESASLPIDQVRALLRSMSAEFGCQPTFRTPFDHNTARHRPLVRLPGDRYLAPTPWSVAHGIHTWMQAHIRDNAQSTVANRYPKHRSDAAERLVRGRFERVFGEQAVYGNQHYNGADGHGEIDCLVAIGTPIVVEVKSHALTESGRRGHRPRIERVARSVVSESFDQTRRARSYIEAGGRDFAEHQGRDSVRRLPAVVGNPVEVVVTLERMDPLATGAEELSGDRHTGGVWVTNVADFLMACDVLDDPAALLHYALTRCKAASLGIQIYVESDALGGYLVDRLSGLIDAAEECDDENMRFALDYSSTEINRFFTLAELGIETELPSTGVPAVLRDTLRTSVPQYSLAWTTIASAVMAAPHDTWRRWKRFVRRHKGDHPFVLPSGKAAIVAVPKLVAHELRTEPMATLAVPRSALT
jgi:hypothetical protein